MEKVFLANRAGSLIKSGVLKKFKHCNQGENYGWL